MYKSLPTPLEPKLSWFGIHWSLGYGGGGPCWKYYESHI